MMTALLAAVMMIGCTEPEAKTFRLLHWNIQNGMWNGQNDNYDRFVEFVKSKDPDVCVWCEAQSIWKTDSDQLLDKADRYLVEHWDREASKVEQGGDKYRAKEIQYICENPIEKVPEAENQLWMMMGDFNSRSRVDNDVYGYADDDPKLLVHDYIKANTLYIDVIKEKYSNEFKPTTGPHAYLD